MKETLFDDAGRHLFDGELDPRALLSYYPDLSGSLFQPEDSVDVFSGVAGDLPEEDSIDDISEYSSSTFAHNPRPLYLPSTTAVHPLTLPLPHVHNAPH